jgi:hypothetical protein
VEDSLTVRILYEMLAGTDKGFLLKRFLRREQSVGDKDADDASRNGTPKKKTAAADNAEPGTPAIVMPNNTKDAAVKSEPDHSGDSSDSDDTPTE